MIAANGIGVGHADTGKISVEGLQFINITADLSLSLKMEKYPYDNRVIYKLFTI